MKVFEYLFWLRESEQVPVILELKKNDDWPTIAISLTLSEMCIFHIEAVVFDWSLFPNQKSQRVDLALKWQGLNIYLNSIYIELESCFYKNHLKQRLTIPPFFRRCYMTYIRIWPCYSFDCFFLWSMPRILFSHKSREVQDVPIIFFYFFTPQLCNWRNAAFGMPNIAFLLSVLFSYRIFFMSSYPVTFQFR